MRGASLTFGGLKIQGFSRAGEQSWFRVDPPGLAFDVGQGAAPLIGTRWIFLSHSHLDHCVGLPWVLTQRQSQGLEAPVVFCPTEMAEDLSRYVAAAGRLEGEELRVEIVGLDPGESRELDSGLRLEAFRVTHTVPALGCHLFRRYRKLESEYEGAEPSEVAQLVREGVEVSSAREELWLSYCGDTGAEVFATEPRLFQARFLLLECTFISPETRAHGARFGHLHLEDLVQNVDRFENQALILCHLSRRHRVSELREAVARKLPTLTDRVHLIAGNESRSQA